MAEVKQEKLKKDVFLNPQRFQLAEHSRSVYRVDVEDHVTREDLSDPKFWAHISSRLRPGDKIEVSWDNGEHYAELYVFACDTTWAHVKEIHFLSLTSKEVEEAQQKMSTIGYDVRHRGGHLKWGIVRLSDKAIVKDGFQTKPEALAWLGEHLRSTNEITRAA